MTRLRIRKSRLLLLEIIVILTTLLGTEAVDPPGYEGCYRKSRPRHFGISPGDYDTANLYLQPCVEACSKWGYQYAGATAGRFCFCANTLPDVSLKEADANCSYDCAYVAAGQKCGSENHLSVYKAPSPIQSVHVSAQNTLLEVFTATTFTAGVEGDLLLSSIEYTMDYGNGVGPTDANATDLFSKTFVGTGIFMITAEARDVFGTVAAKKSSMKVLVQAPVLNVTLYCPAVAATHEEFRCNATVRSGSYMNAKVTFDDGTEDSFSLSDAGWIGAGPGVPQHAGGFIQDNSQVGSYFIMPTSEFSKEASLMGFEFYAATTGDVELLLLTPFCASNSYCYTTNDCPASCNNPRHVDCTGSLFCGFDSTCTNAALTTCAAKPDRYAGVSAMAYTVKAKFPHTISSTGYGVLQIDVNTDIQVSPGDVIGYVSTSAKLATRVLHAGEVADRKHSSVTSVTVDANYPASYAATTSRHLLKAWASRSTRLLTFKTFSEPGDHVVTLNVSSQFLPSWAIDSVIVPVQEGINITEFEQLQCVATGATVDFALLPHSGVNVAYDWDMGDGSATIQTSNPRTSHSFATAGTYNVSVVASNLLTSKSNVTEVCVQDSVDGVELLTEPAAVGATAQIWMNLTSGTDYYCDWDFGDGVTTQTSQATTPLAGSFTAHTYASADDYTVTVSCYNDVSRYNATTLQKVQDPITGIDLKTLGALKNQGFTLEFDYATGTDPSFELSFDGADVSFSPTGATFTSVALAGKPSTGLFEVVIKGTNLVSDVEKKFNFTVEEAISGQESEVEGSRTLIMSGDTVEYSVRLQGGTSVVVTWNWNDGSAPDTYSLAPLEAWSPGHTKTVAHTFNIGGTFDVEVTIANNLNDYTFHHGILVYNRVANLSLETDAPVAFVESHADVKFWFAATSGPPTNASFVIDFGDGSTDGPLPFDLTTNHIHTYNEEGVFTVKVNVSNDLNFMILVETVSIIEPVINMEIYADPKHAPVGSPISFGVTMLKGNGVQLFFDFGETPGFDTVKTRESTNPYVKDEVTHTYWTVGNYTVRIMSSNLLGNTTMDYYLVVQQPVTDAFEITSTAPLIFPPGEVEYTISLPAGAILPTDASVYFDWGDGTTEGPINLFNAVPGSMTRSYTYSEAGDYQAEITIKNIATSLTFPVSGGVYEEIVNVAATAMYDPFIPIGGPHKEGKGPDKDQFPLNKDVMFYVTKDSGTVVLYFVEAVHVDGSSVQICNSTTNPVPMRFPKPGDYNINITAWNPVSSDSHQLVISAVAAVDKAQLEQVDDGDSHDMEATFQISFNEIPADACVTINFGDGTESVYGSDTPCLSETGADKMEGPIANPIPVTHKFPAYAQYEVELVAANYLSQESAMLTLTISNKPCNSPTVGILDQTQDFWEPRKVQRKDRFSVIGRTQLDCSATLVNDKEWTIHRVSKSTAETLEVIDMTPYKETSHNAEISVPARSLANGLYRFSYKVQMEHEITKQVFANTVDTFVEVVPSDLVAALTSGAETRVTRGLDSVITLEPEKHSRDPDVSPSEDQGFTTFNYFCRQKEQAWPRDANGNLLTTNPSTPYTDAELAAGVADLGGCFRQGNGALTLHEGKMSFSSNNFHVNGTYEIAVQVVKGTRSAFAYLEIKVISEPPLNIQINCAPSVCFRTSEGLMVNPSNRLALFGSCDPSCPPDAKYKYIFYREGLSGAHIAIEDFDRYVQGISGINSEHIAVKTQLFEDGFEMYPMLFSYSVKLIVTADGYPDGVASSEFKVNAGPSSGTCSVSPTNGTIMDTLFRINCQGWYDADGIRRYQIIAMFEGDEVEKLIYSGETSFVDTELPLGPEREGYNMTLSARIYDTKEAFTVVNLGVVTVRPLSQERVDDEIAVLLADNQNKIIKAGAEENFNEACRTFLWAAGILNSASESDISEYECADVESRSLSEGYGVNAMTYTVPNHCDSLSAKEKQALKEKYEKRRDDRATLRNQVVEGATSMTLATPDTIEQTLSTFALISQVPEELSRDTQKRMVNHSRSMLRTLVKHEDDVGLTTERIQGTLTTLLAFTGFVLEGVKIGVYHGTISDKKKSRDSELYTYDTYMNATRERNVGKTRLDARTALTEETNTLVQLDTAEDYVPMLFESVEMGAGLARRIIVAGENMSIKTEKMAMEVSKDTADMLTNRTFPAGHGSVALPVWCNLKTGSNCESDEIVTLQITSLPYNPHPYAGTQVSPLSSVITVDFYDKGDNAIPIQNTDERINLTLPRDASLQVSEPKRVADAVIPKKDDDHMFYHSINITMKDCAVHIEVVPENPSVQFLVFVEFGSFPKMKNHSYEAFSNAPHAMGSNDDDRYTVFLNRGVVKGREGKVVIGLRQAEPSEIDVFSDNNLPPEPTAQTGRFTTDYTLKTFTTGCYYLDANQKWSSEGCEVGEGSNELVTECSCNHLTAFGGGLVVQPNKIDWDFVFSNADFFKNPTLYITQIVILLFFLLAVVWARRQDKKDLLKLGVTPLPDNLPNDRYLYQVTVQTGLRRNAATDSKVHFILSGEYDETDVRVLEDPQRKILRRGEVDTFLMATPRPLGPLNYARIWHDNSGRGQYASWYLRYMVVQDLQTKEKSHFIVNKWFAVEEDDGQVDRLVSVAGSEQMVEFGHLFTQSTRKNLGDEHIWFSVVARPPQSRFTRVQRVCCCLCLLYTSMLGNALFYERADGSKGADGFQLGPFALTPQQIYVGVIVTLVVFPINFLVVFLFRKSALKNKRPSRIQEALRNFFRRGDNTSNSSQSDVKELIGSSSLQLGVSSKPGSPDSMGRPQTGGARPRTPPTITQGQPKGKKFKLPWWFVIVAWVLLWLTVAVSAAFVTFYGIMFEDTKCKKWITSMIISFVTSIFLTQPIKVFLVALLFSLIFKKMDTDEDDEYADDEEQPELRTDEDWMYPPPGTDGYTIGRPRKIPYRPPDPEVLEAAREFRVKELKMYDVLREILFYAFFLWLLMVISYGFRDPNSFNLRKGIKATFVDGGRPIKWSTGDNDFRKVTDAANFWNWARDVMGPGLRADIWYNGQPPYGQRGFAADRVGRLMGYATMRQLRVLAGKCETTKRMRTIVPECNQNYEMKYEDTKDYGVGWQPMKANSTWNNTKFEYIYRTGPEIDSYPFWGSHALYSGGGYLVELTGDLKAIRTKMDELRSERWIDRYTRAIFIEFTLYNAQVNLFAIVTLVAEFIDTGGCFVYWRVEPVNLLGYYDGTMLFQIACQVTFLILVFIMIIKELRNMFRQKKSYFTELWNYLELMIISVSIAAIAIYFYRYLKAKSLVKEFKDTHGNGYTKFQYVGYWNELLLYLVGWLVFMATIKFIRLLRFNKRMSLLASTLRFGAKPLCMFGIIFAIVFFAYSQFFYLIYFIDLINFSNIVYTMETCLQMLVGKFNFTAMKFASPVLGPLVFFFYVVTVYYILINMFLTILNESFAAVRRDVSKQSNDHELVEFVVNRFKQWTGLSSIMGPSNGKNGEKGSDQSSSIAPAKPAFDGRVHTVDNFPETVDRLLDSISKVYFNQDKIDDIIRQHGGAGTDKASMKMLMQGKPVKQSLGRMEEIRQGARMSDVEDIHKELSLI